MTDGKLSLGAVVPFRALWQIDSRGHLFELRPGDVVSIQWNWACDRLGDRALKEFARCSQRAITDTKMTL
jgi:hypothetical protein